MLISQDERIYLSGGGLIERVGVRWTFKCDNPACGIVFHRGDSNVRANRSYHYCSRYCSTSHVEAV